MNITAKLSIYMAIVSGAMIACIAGINIYQSKRQTELSMDTLNDEVQYHLSLSLPAALRAVDFESVLHTMQTELSHGFIKAIFVEQPHSEEAFGLVLEDGKIVDYWEGIDLSSYPSSKQELSEPFEGGGDPLILGDVTVYLDRPALKRALARQTLAQIGEQAAIVLTLILVLGVLIHQYLASPLVRIQGAMQGVELASKGEDRISIQTLRELQGKVEQGPLGFEEIRQIWQRFESMIEAISRKEREIVMAKEQAEQANRSKEDFLAVMSHEMRTPLNPILGFIDLMLRDSKIESEQKECLEIMKEAGIRLLNQIDRILAYAKLDRSEAEIKMEPFDPVSSAEKAISLFEAQAASKKIELGLEREEVTEKLHGKRLLVDIKLFEHILYNLLSNAVKYTEKGYIKLSLRIEDLDTGKATLIVEVEDTGIGISKSDKAKLFMPFTQIDATLTRKQEGVGLGLAICQKLCDIAGGRIDVESELGAGSVFSFHLPVAIKAQKELSDFQGEKTLHYSRFTESKEVLLVENDPFNARLVEEMLSSMGVNSVWAKSGQEALTFAQRKLFDCVIMDINMPEMDGLEAMRRLRATETGGDTPVIALTAYVDESIKLKALEAGMRDFIAKPVQYERLFESLRSQFE